MLEGQLLAGKVFFIGLIRADHCGDRRFHPADLLTHGKGDALPLPGGERGIVFQHIQIVHHGAAAVVQHIFIIGNLIAQLLHQRFQPVQMALIAAQQLICILNGQHQPIQILMPQPL